MIFPLPFAAQHHAYTPGVVNEDGNTVPGHLAPVSVACFWWNDAGSGVVSQQVAGVYQQTVDTRQKRRNMFWPSEITDLQKICSQGSGAAFSIDTAPAPMAFRSRPAHLRGFDWPDC